MLYKGAMWNFLLENYPLKAVKSTTKKLESQEVQLLAVSCI